MKDNHAMLIVDAVLSFAVACVVFTVTLLLATICANPHTLLIALIAGGVVGIVSFFVLMLVLVGTR